MRIPEVRERLREIGNKLTEMAVEIEDLIGELHRRSPIRKAPKKSRPLTPTLIRQIRAFQKANPFWDLQSIATQFNINAGRVSEALRGKRK